MAFVEENTSWKPLQMPFARLKMILDASALENLCLCIGASSKGTSGCKENHFYSLPFGQAEASI